MKRFVLLCGVSLVLTVMTACKSRTAMYTYIDTDVVIASDYYDTWDSDEWERLSVKIQNGDLLVPDEWYFIFENIDRSDGYLSEGMGNSLFKSLKGNLWYNEQLASNLNTLAYEEREKVLYEMMILMSIDIAAEEKRYTWLEFVEQFPSFIGSPAAKEALDEIYDNRD
ncbi:MAG: hypothetical protein J5848_07655 [Bacteroidales bacterium]|nr:hypothetical protein [Bacteroidales bacterium]